MNDLRQLQYFIAVAEKLHFGLAAQSLHITQPPLSRQITALEKSLGVQLIKRHSRHASLTPAGERFLQDSKAILALYQQACRNAQLAHAGELGSLNIGFMMHAAHSSVPVLTRQFIGAYPNINLQLRESLPSRLPAELEQGQFDAIITFDPGPMHGIHHCTILHESLCLVVPEQHPLADCSSVSAKQLGGEPLIMTPREVAPTLHNSITQYFVKAGMERPRTRLETQLQQTIVSLVSEGIGIALVPRSLQKLGKSGVRFITLEHAPVVEQLLVWRKDNINPVLQHLLAMVREDAIETSISS